MNIVTRFAPSPTGHLHIGGMRTALYAYALARKHGGTFILRIEDTDQKREVPGSVEAIQTVLQQFGITWDAYYRQSERAESGLYRQHAEALVASGHAFYCTCDPKNAKLDGYSKELRDPCRDKGYTHGAIKLRTPDGMIVSYYDIVFKKEISWDTSTIADATLLKSDGVFPTYHLAVVVDDNAMAVSDVLRGYDWLPSTPIHLLVYQYLGYAVPRIGHLTDIQEIGGGKLSKRKGSYSCTALIQEGYLPEAIRNFVMLLGWAPKDDKEQFTLQEFVDYFSVDGLQKSNPAYNKVKLDWFNREYLRALPHEEQQAYVARFFVREIDAVSYNESILGAITPLILERASNGIEVGALATTGEFAYFFEAPEYDATCILNKKTKIQSDTPYVVLQEYLGLIEQAVDGVASSAWSVDAIQSALASLASTYGNTDILGSLRFVLSGRDRSSDPFTIANIIGKTQTLSRIQHAITKLQMIK